MTKVDDGGPAFPGEKETRFGQHNDCNEGMSLRDYFAGLALQGLIASNDREAGDRIDEIPNYAYHIADGMLRARREGSEQS